MDFISICKPLKVIECPAIRLGGLPGLMLGRNLKDCERGRDGCKIFQEGKVYKGGAASLSGRVSFGIMFWIKGTHSACKATVLGNQIF